MDVFIVLEETFLENERLLYAGVDEARAVALAREKQRQFDPYNTTVRVYRWRNGENDPTYIQPE